MGTSLQEKSFMKKIFSSLKKPNLFKRTWKKLLSFFFFEQWTLLISKNIDYKSISWEKFIPLKVPRDRFWADPFPWKKDDLYYVFYEELPYSTNTGHISCITLDEGLNIISNQIVLKRPYHLSYPFIFEHENQFYMIPETHKNKGIELYRCESFPDKWEFVKTLFPDIVAVDATLIESNGKWWMFANVIEQGGSSKDTLHLYYSSNPLSDQWTPHPLNPIIKNIRTARPAGRIFHDGEKIIRPSQDCSLRYGYATNFNQIVILSETEYKEKQLLTFTPPLGDKKILSTHTWNEHKGLSTIDSEFRRSTLF